MALGNLASRALVAVVAVPVVLLILHLDQPEPTFVLMFVASLLAMRELFGMTLPDPRDRVAGLIMGGASAAALYWLSPVALHWVEMDHATGERLLLAGPLVAVMLAVIPPGLYYLFRFGDIDTSAQRAAYTIMGIVYVGLTCTCLSLCKRDLPKGSDFVALILLIAWVGDTGAYFAGRFLGNAKLYPAVSPKKTWAGAIGGLAGSTAAVVVMKLAFLDDVLSWFDVVAIAIPGAILGQLGDLFESLLKRSVGVKDSGSLLPGHGGMLDRIDAVLFIGPYVYLYVLITL